MKQELKERFERLFKDCHLYCVQLNGFSHTIFYKDKDGKKHIAKYSGYASSCEYEKETLYEDGVYRSYCEDKTKVFFMGYPNYQYQNNAKELIFENIERW